MRHFLPLVLKADGAVGMGHLSHSWPAKGRGPPSWSEDGASEWRSSSGQRHPEGS